MAHSVPLLCSQASIAEVASSLAITFAFRLEGRKEGRAEKVYALSYKVISLKFLAPLLLSLCPHVAVGRESWKMHSYFQVAVMPANLQGLFRCYGQVD